MAAYVGSAAAGAAAHTVQDLRCSCSSGMAYISVVVLLLVALAHGADAPTTHVDEDDGVAAKGRVTPATGPSILAGTMWSSHDRSVPVPADIPTATHLHMHSRKLQTDAEPEPEPEPDAEPEPEPA